MHTMQPLPLSTISSTMRRLASAPFSSLTRATIALAVVTLTLATTSNQVAQAAVVPLPQGVESKASLQVGIPTSRSRSPVPKPSTTPTVNPAATMPFPLGTYQVDPFHTISFRPDGSALVAAHQLCFQQSDCPATTFAGSWTYSPDSHQLRVATTSPIVSAMRWTIVTPTSSSPSTGVVKMKLVPGSEEGDFPVEPRLNEKLITSVGRTALRAAGRASVDNHSDRDANEDDEDDLKDGEEPWMYIEGP
ncbi:hypothetical protein BCR44DRAFT_1438623 [Catenaria anguillulae PL171]|uniref:Uncharacterized protein n=1 Tax=Catenaria anguillulae PL171 TaxID=765915 RepID=A0A1Y2HH99_9FUNG|nr:hypothetical protein BCR44DRAFT_1438623 [Catenaria anguillulae PL171]